MDEREEEERPREEGEREGRERERQKTPRKVWKAPVQTAEFVDDRTFPKKGYHTDQHGRRYVYWQDGAWHCKITRRSMPEPFYGDLIHFKNGSSYRVEDFLFNTRETVGDAEDAKVSKNCLKVWLRKL